MGCSQGMWVALICMRHMLYWGGEVTLLHARFCRSMRIRALQELKACITLAYKQADKRAQAAIHTDCMVAITTWQADR